MILKLKCNDTPQGFHEGTIFTAAIREVVLHALADGLSRRIRLRLSLHERHQVLAS